MKVTVSLERSIGHRLLGYEGKCGFIHGHNYMFSVTLNGNPNALGLVVDFTKMKTDLRQILEIFDHALVLHEDDPAAEVLRQEKLVLLTVNPSAENLASFVYGKMVDRGYSPSSVIVRETEDGWAEATAVDRSVKVKAVQ